MPQAVAAFGLGALATAAGWSTVAVAFQTIAINSILGGVSKALAKKPGPTITPAKGTVTGATRPLQLVFGKRRIGGNAVYLGTSGTHNEKLHFVLAMSLAPAGGCHDITDVYFDGNVIEDADIESDGDVSGGTYAPSSGHAWWPDTTWANIRRYLGTSTQTADATLDAAFTDWASTAYGRGVAYLAIWFYRDLYRDGKFRDLYPNGQPACSAVLWGIKCYDSRLDTTNGGSGSARYDDETTWTYSANPAVQSATYAIMQTSDGGCGLDPATQVNWAVAAASANVCDESRTIPNGGGGSTTQARYESNVVLPTDRRRRDNLATLASTMAGRIFVSGGKLQIHAGYYASPTATIDETWMRGKAAMSPIVSREHMWNAVRASYDRADIDWRTVVAKPYTNSTYETEDQGKRLWDSLDLPGTTDEYQAQHLMTVRGRQSRMRRQFTLPLNMRGRDLEPMQTVTVDLDEFGTTFVGRVVNLKIHRKGVDATLIQDEAAVWSFTYPTDYTETNGVTTPAVTKESPIVPAGYSVTATEQGIQHKWNPVPDDCVTDIDVSSSSGGTFTSLLTGVAGNSAITPASGGVALYFKIKHRYRNTASSYSDEKTTSATGAATIPDYWDEGAGASCSSDSVDFPGAFNTDAAGLAVPYPAGLSSGTVLLLQLTAYGGGTIDTIDIDTLTGEGFAQLSVVTNGTGNFTQEIWGKRATGSEVGDLTVNGTFKVGSTGTHHADNVIAGRMYGFISVLGSGTYYEGVAGSARAASTTITPENITTSTNNALAIQFIGLDDDVAIGSFTTESGTDYTEAVAEYTTTTGRDLTLQIQVGDKATAGAITGGSLTIATSEASIVQGLALLPTV